MTEEEFYAEQGLALEAEIAESTALEAIQPPKGMSLASIETCVANATAMAKAMNTIFNIVVEITNPTDWRDMGGKPYLESAGCSKVGTSFGIKYGKAESSKEIIIDDTGYRYAIIIVTGTVEWNGSVKVVTGTASTKDDFFSLRKDYKTGENYRLSMAEISMPNVIKKAWTNWQNRGLKATLGLNFTWEELTSLSNGRITKQSGITYKDKKADTANNPQRDLLRDAILTKFDGDKTKAREFLVNATKFTTPDGKEVAGKDSVDKLSDKQVAFLANQLKI